MKAHARNIGNELADRLAKEATKNRNVTPISAIKKDIREESVRKWQRQWEETEKGSITKEYFPSVESRLAVKLNLSPKVTTIMTGHGNIRSYLHRLKITKSAECPCKQGIQTVDHLIFQCSRLKNERETLKRSLGKVAKWPVNKRDLTNRYLKLFTRYINTINWE